MAVDIWFDTNLPICGSATVNFQEHGRINKQRVGDVGHDRWTQQVAPIFNSVCAAWRKWLKLEALVQESWSWVAFQQKMSRWSNTLGLLIGIYFQLQSGKCIDSAKVRVVLMWTYRTRTRWDAAVPSVQYSHGSIWFTGLDKQVAFSDSESKMLAPLLRQCTSSPLVCVHYHLTYNLSEINTTYSVYCISSTSIQHVCSATI